MTLAFYYFISELFTKETKIRYRFYIHINFNVHLHIHYIGFTFTYLDCVLYIFVSLNQRNPLFQSGIFIYLCRFGWNLNYRKNALELTGIKGKRWSLMFTCHRTAVFLSLPVHVPYFSLNSFKWKYMIMMLFMLSPIF